MWKEVISIEDMKEVALLRYIVGCSVNPTALSIKSAIEKKPDCHYYHYKSDTIELVLAFKQMEDHIFVLAYTFKAEIKDYPKAIRLMALKSLEYLKERDCKKFIAGFGLKDETAVNFYNKGLAKIGFSEVMNMCKPIYENIGLSFTIEDKRIIIEEV